jgi:transposase
LDILARHKEAIETALFDARRDLFSVDVQLVFFDTTTLYFEGEGPADLAARGHSKDHRPQSPQVVVCVVTDLEGYPLTCEVFPGNLSDFDTVEKVIGLLKKRFAIKNTVLVCDSGMMSAKNLRRIRRAGMDYIIGVRMRVLSEVRREVLSRGGRYADLEDNLRVKEVWVGNRRYIVCHNPEEAERDRLVRQKVVERLEAAIKAGEVKKTVGHRGYARFLQLEKGAASINYDKVREEARYDGKFVLRTSTDFPAGLVALAYKSLWVVEALNRAFKDLLETRPIYHKVSRRVTGHVVGSFLSLLLATILRARLKRGKTRKDGDMERQDDLRWAKMLEDLKALHGIKLNLNGKPFLVRTELQGLAHKAFEAVGVRPPPRVQAWSDQ